MGWLKIAQVMASEKTGRSSKAPGKAAYDEDNPYAIDPNEQAKLEARAAQLAAIERAKLAALEAADRAREMIAEATIEKTRLEALMIDADISSLPCSDRAPIKLVNQITKSMTKTALTGILGKNQAASVWASLPQKTKKVLTIPIKGAPEAPEPAQE